MTSYIYIYNNTLWRSIVVLPTQKAKTFLMHHMSSSDFSINILFSFFLTKLLDTSRYFFSISSLLSSPPPPTVLHHHLPPYRHQRRPTLSISLRHRHLPPSHFFLRSFSNPSNAHSLLLSIEFHQIPTPMSIRSGK